jgi:hypothetical protein
MKFIKSHFFFYHILVVRPEAWNKSVIPEDGIRQAPELAMFNHLIWFLESDMDEYQDKKCHYSPGAYIFTREVISLREEVTVVGNMRWEQTTEHYRAFSAIAMQLLHDVGVIFLRWIMIPPPRN